MGATRRIDRFHELVRVRYFDEARFFRVIPGFVAQFGVNKDYDVHDKWRKYFIVDDPLKDQKNSRGTLSFAQSGPNTRATEIFINLGDNKVLDDQSFVPFARVVDGMDVIDKFYAGYGDLRPEGKEIDPGRLEEGTNAYLIPHFPKMDYIKLSEDFPPLVKLIYGGEKNARPAHFVTLSTDLHLRVFPPRKIYG